MYNVDCEDRERQYQWLQGLGYMCGRAGLLNSEWEAPQRMGRKTAWAKEQAGPGKMQILLLSTAGMKTEERKDKRKVRTVKLLRMNL